MIQVYIIAYIYTHSLKQKKSFKIIICTKNTSLNYTCQKTTTITPLHFSAGPTIVTSITRAGCRCSSGVDPETRRCKGRKANGNTSELTLSTDFTDLAKAEADAVHVMPHPVEGCCVNKRKTSTASRCMVAATGLLGAGGGPTVGRRL